MEVDNPEAEDGIIKWDKASGATKGYWLKDADQILTLITEEIEKVENPYVPPLMATLSYIRINRYEAFEHCRQKILSLLKE